MTTQDRKFLTSIGASDEQPSVTGLMELHKHAEYLFRAEAKVTEDRLRSEVQTANESLEAERAQWKARRTISEKHLSRVYMLLVAAALLAAWGVNDALRLRAYERGCVEIAGGWR